VKERKKRDLAEIVWAFVLLLVAVGPTVWKEGRTRKLRLRDETEIRETEIRVFEEELMKAHWFCGLTEGPEKKKKMKREFGEVGMVCLIKG
jgi:hypothetical protein